MATRVTCRPSVRSLVTNLLQSELPQVEPSKYQKPVEPSEAADSDEILTLRLRYKHPQADESEELSFPVVDAHNALDSASRDFKFAAAVACFGMLLRDSEHKADATFDLVVNLAQSGKGDDSSGYRSEFIQLVKLAEAMGGR